jgi:hypothetical protein
MQTEMGSFVGAVTMLDLNRNRPGAQKKSARQTARFGFSAAAY